MGALVKYRDTPLVVQEHRAVELALQAEVSYPAKHLRDGISQTALRPLRRAPACYRDEYILGNRGPETDAMRMGAALHTAVLEPHKWDDEIAVEEKVDGRTKAGKEYRATFAEASAGKTILRADQAQLVLAAAASLRAHPHVETLLEQECLIEHEISWTDEITGAKCRGRPDLVIPSLGIVADVKSCRDASATPFVRSVAAMYYDIQAAYYIDGLRANGIKVDTWLWLAIEIVPPYLCAVYQINELDLVSAQAQYRRDLRVFQHCCDLDDWPGLDSSVQEITLPTWAAKQRAEALEVDCDDY
jgi:hypothetical protein